MNSKIWVFSINGTTNVPIYANKQEKNGYFFLFNCLFKEWNYYLRRQNFILKGDSILFQKLSSFRGDRFIVTINQPTAWCICIPLDLLCIFLSQFFVNILHCAYTQPRAAFLLYYKHIINMISALFLFSSFKDITVLCFFICLNVVHKQCCCAHSFFWWCRSCLRLLLFLFAWFYFKCAVPFIRSFHRNWLKWKLLVYCVPRQWLRTTAFHYNFRKIKNPAHFFRWK